MNYLPLTNGTWESSKMVATNNEILVVGLGAIGISIAYFLQKKGHSVLGVSKRNLPSSFTTQIIHGGIKQSFSLSTQSIFKLGELKIDKCLVLLCCKEYELDKILPELAKHLGKNTTYLLLQNGIDVTERARSLIPSSKLFRGTLLFGAERDDVKVKIYGSPIILSEKLPEKSKAILETAFELREAPSAEEVELKKLGSNLIANLIGSAYQVRNKAIFESKELAELARQVYDEYAAALQIENFKPPSLDRILDGFMSFGGNRNSTLVDIEKGNPTELDAIAGRFLRKYEKYGLKFPTIRALLKKLEDP